MRLSPHTYQRLALVSCTKYTPKNLSTMKDSCEIDLFQMELMFGIHILPEEIQALQILREIYLSLEEFIKSQPQLLRKYDQAEMKPLVRIFVESRISTEQLESYTKNLFPTRYEAATFFHNFRLINNICRIIDLYYNYAYKLAMGFEIRSLLKLTCSCYSIYAIPDVLKNSIDELACEGEDFFLKDKKNIKRLLDAYVEFYHYTNSLAYNKTIAPSSGERIRRQRISSNKKGKNYDRRIDIATHIEQIIKEKDESRKATCSAYFEKNKEVLKKLGITSYRTLENYCSRYLSNKDPNHIRNQKNTMDTKLPILERELRKIIEAQ